MCLYSVFVCFHVDVWEQQWYLHTASPHHVSHTSLKKIETNNVSTSVCLQCMLGHSMLLRNSRAKAEGVSMETARAHFTKPAATSYTAIWTFDIMQKCLRGVWNEVTRLKLKWGGRENWVTVENMLSCQCGSRSCICNLNECDGRGPQRSPYC